MKISFENPDKINGLMTLTVEVDDYKEKVEKTLKDYRKKANVPGFRPGNVPMNIIKRQYGTAVKVDVVNKIIGEEMYKYLRENNVKMLGEPLPSEKQVPQDLEKEGDYEFIFDIAVAPEFTISLSNKDKVDYFDIQPDDKLIDQQVEMFASRNGHYDKAEVYDPEQRDMLKGDLRQLDDEGNTLEGGITVADAVLMPQYIKEEAQKALFDGAKLGDIITFNPKKAYPESDTEVAALLKLKKEEVTDINADFSFQVTEISRFVKSALDQDLFDSVFGEGNVKTEEEFRARIAEGLKAQLAGESDYRFLLDVRKYAENKVGEITFPEDILKRVMKAGNKDKDADYVDKHFDASIRELKWHLIKEQLVAANDVKIEDTDVKAVAKEMARAQFAQYGMNNVPDEYLEGYADDMLKQKENVDSLVDRAIDRKLIDVLKNVVKLNVKTVTLDEFNKIAAE
ncbi:MAG: trigger factor [Prevotella sp.]|nr:trigger factor [Prevotella sp.]